MAARVRWTSFVTRQAEKRAWSWAWWQFDGDFVLYDVRQDQWVEPIRRALVPSAVVVPGSAASGIEPSRKVIDYLKSQGCVLMNPSEYLEKSTSGEKRSG
jgi:hypothetical protein